MADQAYIIEEGVPVIKVAGRGRKKGSGSNLKMLAKMKPGSCISMVPRDKMQSIRTSAYRSHQKLKIRRIPETNYYVIWKA